MTIQKTEWSQIEWYEYTRGEAGQTPGMNVGRIPFRHLLASQPMHLDEKMLLEKKEEPGEELLSREEKVQLLYIAVESIRTQFLERLHYAYAIFDCTGTPVLKSQYFPTHCL